MLALLVQLQHSKTNNSSNNNNVSNINSKNHQQYIKNQEKKENYRQHKNCYCAISTWTLIYIKSENITNRLKPSVT